MTSKLKTPSSARRHIKIEQFTQFVSASRLRHVQSIIRKEDTIDSFLAIGGIDSRYSEGSLELLNYLLFGFFEVRKEEFEKSGYSEEIVDDIMILVGRDDTQIYCNPINYHYLLPYTSHWPSVQYHCLGEDEFEGEDDDASEEFKIRSLIAMTSFSSCIGIPFYGRGFPVKKGASFDVMSIEKWPIIQAFALEDFGGGGFFTLKHEVCDVSSHLHTIYNFQDPVTMEILLTEHMPLMSRQWDNMMKCVKIALSDPGMKCLPTNKFAEPLKSYFNHGLVGSKGRVGNLPFLLLDNDATKQGLASQVAGDSAAQGDVGMDTQNVHTLVSRAVSPHSPIMCARTYFITKQPYTIPTGPQGEGSPPESGTTHLELRYYVGVYLAMVHAVLAAIERYSHTSSPEKARKALMSDLMEGCSQVDTPELRAHLNGQDVEFTLESISIDNTGLPLPEGQYSPVMKHICLTLHRLPPPPGCQSGHRTLMFAETFLDSRIYVEKAPDVGSDFFILTSCVPRYQLWSVCGWYKKRTVSAPELPTEVWGDLLMAHDDILLSPTWPALLPPEKVVLAAWDHGISIQSHSYGTFAIHGSQMKAVSMYDGNSMSQVALLSILVRPSAALRAQLPPHLQVDFDQTGQVMILLGVAPHSKAHMELYRDVLSAWKLNSKVPNVERPEDLDGDLWPIHSYLQHKHDSTSKADTPLKKISLHNPELFDYLEHLSMASCLNQPVPRSVYSSLMAQSQATSDPDKIIVTVIQGAPGSDKENLGTLLTTFNKNIVNWLVYRQPSECSLDYKFLHRSMDVALQSRDQSQMQTRVVLIAPGFADTSAVVAGLQSHVDPKVRSQFTIGAVTVCIDPLNFYMDHKLVLPPLMAQCAQGWINNLVFTSQTTAPSELLDRIQELVRSVNHDVALFKAEDGDVKRSTDLDLIMSETAFQEEKFVKARLLMKPVGPSGLPEIWTPHPPMKDVMIRFTLPLEKYLTLIKLRTIKGSLKGNPFEGNIYFVRGYLAFTGSPTMVDLQFSPLSGKLSLTDSRSGMEAAGEVAVAYIVNFTGVGLKEAELKAFLRTCVKQKPEKKPLVTRKDVSQKDIDRLHKEHHLTDLPEGWFYNGSRFVSMTGERSNKHPSLEVFIQNFMDSKNKEIQRFNQRAESDDFVNLFP